MIADDVLTRFIWVVTDGGFTSLMVSIENNTGTTDDILFKQLVDILIYLPPNSLRSNGGKIFIVHNFLKKGK